MMIDSHSFFLGLLTGAVGLILLIIVIICFAGLFLFRLPKAERASLCPHGNEWDDCPECNH